MGMEMKLWGPGGDRELGGRGKIHGGWDGFILPCRCLNC